MEAFDGEGNDIGEGSASHVFNDDFILGQVVADGIDGEEVGQRLTLQLDFDHLVAKDGQPDTPSCWWLSLINFWESQHGSEHGGRKGCPVILEGYFHLVYAVAWLEGELQVGLYAWSASSDDSSEGGLHWESALNGDFI